MISTCLEGLRLLESVRNNVETLNIIFKPKFFMKMPLKCAKNKSRDMLKVEKLKNVKSLKLFIIDHIRNEKNYEKSIDFKR